MNSEEVAKGQKVLFSGSVVSGNGSLKVGCGWGESLVTAVPSQRRTTASTKDTFH
jgi:cyclopropane fatty-acyl-phospholipid synthase-like methyltransferase